MDAAAIKREIKRYWMSPDGLLGLQKEPASGACENGILYLSQFILLLRRLGLVGASEIQEYVMAIGNCQRVWNGRPVPGLFNRGQYRQDSPEYHDDYVGIVAVSNLYGLSFHRDICAYGEAHGWCYNNVSPGTWDIKYVRQGSEIATYRRACNKFVAPWLYLWLLGNLTVSVMKPKQSTSEKLLSWVRLEMLAHNSKYWAMVRSAWLKVLRLTNPGGMPEVFKIYFGNHPIVELARLALD